MSDPAIEAEPRGSRAKHRAIMDAAARVFLREGYAGASVDAIAAEAGVSKRTVYNHFRDKEHLFQSIVQETLGSVAAEFDRALAETIDDSDDLEREFVALGRRWVRLFLREDASALRRLCIAEVGRHPEIMHGWSEAGPLRAQGQLVDRLAALDRRGRLAIPDPRRAAEQLALLVTTPAFNRSMLGSVRLSDPEVDDIIVPNIRMFLRAYRPGL